MRGPGGPRPPQRHHHRTRAAVPGVRRVPGTQRQRAVHRRERADRWGRTIILGAPGHEVLATGINNQGQIVGFFDGNSHDDAILYQDGTTTDLTYVDPELEDPPLTLKDALAINNQGEIVGTDGAGAAIERNGVVTEIGGSFGDGNFSRGEAINDLGQVVFGVSSIDGSGSPERHFLESNGTTTNLAALGGKDAQVRAINNQGQIVGSYQANVQRHAYLYSGGTLNDLGTLGGTESNAESVNNAGQVVGFSLKADGTGSAFLYQDGAMIDLASLLPADSGWQLGAATGINNHGQIVGMGHYKGASVGYLIDLGLPGHVDLTLSSQYSDEGGTPSPSTAVARVAVPGAPQPAAEPHFGHFLVNVPLQNQFTVSVAGDVKDVASVAYSIDGEPARPAKRVGMTDQWQFTRDVGALGDAPHALVVTSFDAKGNTLGTVTGHIDMKDSLDYHLKATDPGGPAGGVDVGQLRFIRGISLPTGFTGTITDLPYYYVKTLLVQVPKAAQPGDLNVVSTGPLDGAKFTFAYDTATLPAGLTPVLLLFPGPNGVVAPPGTTAPTLCTVELPSWLAGSVSSYDASQASYVIKPDSTLSLKAPLPITSGIPLSPFDGLESSLSIGVRLTVTARLTANPGDVNVTAHGYTAGAKFLGSTLLDVDSPLSTGLLHVAALLDPKTLASPTGISVTTDPISLLKPGLALFKVPFGTGNKPLIVLTPAAFGGSLSLNGVFQADASLLTIQAGFQLDVSGPKAVFLKGGTFVELKAEGGVSLVLKAMGSLGFSILPFKLLSGVIAGGISAVADADVIVNFAGPLADIATSLNPDSIAGVTIGYGFAYDYAVAGDAEITEEPDIHPLGPYPLFGLKAPAVPSFASLKGLILTGPGDTTTPGLPTLGKTTPSPSPTPQANALAASGPGRVAAAVAPPGPTSQLTVVTPVFGPITSASFGLDVLGDRGTLAPGRHFLDVVLVAPDGGEIRASHLDLSTFPLAGGSGPLGNSSGFRIIRVPIAGLPLGLGVPYQVVFRLFNDASTGQTVAVTLESLAFDRPTSNLGFVGPDGTSIAGPIDFGPVAGGTGVVPITLVNRGGAALAVNSLSFLGTGFTLANPVLGAGFDIPAGATAVILVRLVDPTLAANATLHVESDSPSLPSYDLALTYAGAASATGGSGGAGGSAGGTGGTVVGSPTPTGELELSPVELGRHVLVETLFREILGRSPDAVGMSVFVARLDAQEAPEGVARALMNSPERHALARRHAAPRTSLGKAIRDAEQAGGRAAAVATLYHALLERSPEAAGFRYWQGRLASKTPVASIAAAFARSTEHRALVLNPTVPVTTEAAATRLALANRDRVVHPARPKSRR